MCALWNTSLVNRSYHTTRNKKEEEAKWVKLYHADGYTCTFGHIFNMSNEVTKAVILNPGLTVLSVKQSTTCVTVVIRLLSVDSSLVWEGCVRYFLAQLYIFSLFF